MALQVVSKVEVPELVEKRRGQILKAAIELYGRQGYHVTTIREVAHRAKVSVGLIYQYVADKEDVLFLALVEVLDSYLREIPLALEGLTDPMERFCAAVHAYGRVIDARIDATLLVYRETKSLGRPRRELLKAREIQSNQLISDAIEACVRAGLFDAVDVEMLTYMIVMFCHAWALKSWRFRGRLTIDAYLDRGLKLMLEPVVTPSGRRGFLAVASRPAAAPGPATKARKPRRPA
ncbi:TetR/AcrR family transcriptional regulator [Ramlibacter alkalitolerans]|uniref:TetR family transcriptional regulator n=1 Tax=Ramlibacter alkalitolerans TaxID=2039631 RepID=A0ABS1JWF9_9BURK|nr:TetR/AcrR family transcriptional regulator [Ramlibacter alkalitolerans]MBL0428191.1 TetR family transcriptional regulator [Ramlibacter alkalitolerans]